MSVAFAWRSDGEAAPPPGIDAPAPGEHPWLATALPGRRRGRPLKRWRYVGVFCARAMVCVGDVHIGPARQTFWAIWDRERATLHQRTNLVRHGRVRLAPGRVAVDQDGVALELALDERPGIASICSHGATGYVWTRKQGGVGARGRLELPGRAAIEIDARAVIDDTAGYHARRTDWKWSAGVGAASDGTPLAWNLVAGVNDPLAGSERTIWIGADAAEAGPARFAEDLSSVAVAAGGELRFAAEATRSRRENLLLVRSDYEQPFGTFSGSLPGGVELREGFGVMERHSARW